MNWSENRALGYPFYTRGADSAVIIFDNVKILKYENLSNQLINDKNLYIIDTYDKETLSSERRNEENIKFTFVFTAQDYAVADTL